MSVVKRSFAWFTRKFKQRDKIIIMAYKSGHYTRNEIGKHFGISHTTVSRVVKQVDVQMETCPCTSFVSHIIAVNALVISLIYVAQHRSELN